MRLRPLLLVSLLCISFWGLLINMFIGIGINTKQGGEKPFSPILVNDIQLWLDSSVGVMDSSGNPVVSDGQKVATWLDQSGRGAHAIQADPDRQPIFRTGANGRNGKPVLAFSNAANTGMVSGNVSLKGATVFSVFSPNTSTGTVYEVGVTKIYFPVASGGFLLDIIGDSPSKGLPLYHAVFQKGSGAGERTYVPSFGAVASSGPPYQGWNLYGHRHDGTAYSPGDVVGGTTIGPWGGTSLYSRGRNMPKETQLAGGAGTSQKIVPVSIGMRNTGAVSLDGKFAELIVFDRALEGDEHQNIENYLSAKWNIPLLR